MRPTASSVLYLAAPLLLSLADAFPHDDHHSSGTGMDMNIDGGMNSDHSDSAPSNHTTDSSGEDYPMSYFAYQKHSGVIMAHIVFMVLAWFFTLPIGVMFSVARSRLALPAQFLFLILNALGLLLGIVYNSQTPDLYESNVHHKIGWIATWAMIAQTVMGIVLAYSGRGKDNQGSPHERATFLPAMRQQDQYPTRPMHEYHWSGDSGQGTERASSSIHSPVSPTDGDRIPEPDVFDRYGKPEGELEDEFDGDSRRTPVVGRFSPRRLAGLVSGRGLNIMRVVYGTIDRIILILGFIAMVTGAVVYGGIFRGNNVFNGLAHFIKGGIFFWYGLLTFGRWMGCFADLGWAWNLKPSRDHIGKWKSRVPSGEFTESFVIFLYGSTNVFLEHLSAWGGEWTAQDLEHVAISVMFFGGGLCGMLIESKRVRDWLNDTVFQPSGRVELHGANAAVWQAPESQRSSLNPMPGLVILLLGMMMSSHHQDSMVSTMVHAQWGMLLVAFALARAVTYILLFLKPPTSLFPARPPSEVIASFCLISGGLIFMLSTKDVIAAMEYYDLNAMFTFTVGMGFTAFIMAWELIAVALKAWATRREQPPAIQTFQFPA